MATFYFKSRVKTLKRFTSAHGEVTARSLAHAAGEKRSWYSHSRPSFLFSMLGFGESLGENNGIIPSSAPPCSLTSSLQGANSLHF